jgi:hypothetical protein
MEILKPTPSQESRDTVRDRVIEREAGKPGLRGKINAFCCHCIYDPYQTGSWLKQVEKCTSWHCPLYSVRPLPKGIKHKEVDDG